MSTEADEERAKQRYVMLQLARIGSIIAVMAGIAIARDVLPAPYWLGVVLAVGGLIAFFFGPTLLARRFKAGDRMTSDRIDQQ